LGLMLLSRHNITYYQDLTRGARDAIAKGQFDAYQHDFHERYNSGDIEPI